MTGVYGKYTTCMRSFRWPRPLLPTPRPLLFNSRLLCRRSSYGHRLYSTGSSVLDSQGRIVYYEPPASYLGTDERVPLDRWLQPELVSAVKKAFPSVKYATTTQQELFRAVVLEQDVMLHTPTGSGKSFALMLAMMSKERKRARAQSITSLIIVPHRDLVYQYLRWIQRIHAVIPELGSLDSVAQILVRDSSVPLEGRLERLRSEPPHILIGTPQALLDAYQGSPKTLVLDKLSSVVVDEIDYLIDWTPPTRDKYKLLKARRMMRKHPSPTRQLLDAIYRPMRMPISKKKQMQLEKEGAPIAQDDFGINRPQLIMTSATFRAPVRRFLYESGGWFKPAKGWAKISSLRKPDSDIKPTEENRAVFSLGGTSIQHHVLVVSKTGTVRNVTSDKDVSRKGRTNAMTRESRRDHDEVGSPSVVEAATDAKESADSTELPESDTETLPYSQYALEAVAEAFALDVPRLALLVLPASAPVREVLGELRRLGVNAQGLNVLEEEAGGAYLTQEAPEEVTENPTLLVSTLATTRGLDLPSLTHVFILGLPKTRPSDAYMHAAGRVGRFGRSGKVITVIEEQRLVTTRKGEKRWVDQPSILCQAMRIMGVVPTKLVHFP
ncbi:P-loop containing nucleoside triphosphate hydrolase protein [Daedalea quercina L-15889]|uniref:RNA helicase n=1 Tax=Daedalea quercina L-15889 TaxID=1314783 RepID=A0A165UME5_9APHY|nr:P-loop containing nucleoside triphosphate hydrolase protein [Daedalea quercina L-15889]